MAWGGMVPEKEGGLEALTQLTGVKAKRLSHLSRGDEAEMSGPGSGVLFYVCHRGGREDYSQRLKPIFEQARTG